MCGRYYYSLKTRNLNYLFISAYTFGITTVMLAKMKKQHGTAIECKTECKPVPSRPGCVTSVSYSFG